MLHLPAFPKESEKKPTARRMGPPGTPTWHTILDGAEAVLREGGYAALNARRIADHVGIKRQLVYYYFRDNDHLLVELIDRSAKRVLERLEAALASDKPLRETWDVGIFMVDARLIAEITALASRSPAARKAVFNFVAASRAIQIAALKKALKNWKSPRLDIPVSALAIIAMGVALVLEQEAAIGFTRGHRETKDLIQRFLAQTESKGSKQARSKPSRPERRRPASLQLD
jgi:AcrR family transcriptional regulator